MAAALTVTFGFAQAANTFNASQTQAIQKIIHDYLLSNPKILVEASQALQDQQVQNGIRKNAKALFASSVSPVIGNLKGQVSVVEFFDYQCPHCKQMTGNVDKLIKKNPNVRYIFKEFPIFGKSSQEAASAALASAKQGKYMAFHDALMETKGRLNMTKILAVAKKVGLNTAKLEKDMANPAIKAELRNNYLLAQELGIMGTPAFVVGPYPEVKGAKYGFVPGATTLAKLQGLINKAEGKA